MGKVQLPEVIECPKCRRRAKPHCDREMYPGAHCNWYVCWKRIDKKGKPLPDSGCGYWTEVTYLREKDPTTGKRLVVWKQGHRSRYMDQPQSSS